MLLFYFCRKDQTLQGIKVILFIQPPKMMQSLLEYCAVSITAAAMLSHCNNVTIAPL